MEAEKEKKQNRNTKGKSKSIAWNNKVKEWWVLEKAAEEMTKFF